MPDELTREELADYRDVYPNCEVWTWLPDVIKRDIACEKVLYHRRIAASDIAHICRGAGRVNYLANILHLSRLAHVWCDNHGRAGQVLLFYAKWIDGRADWKLWGKLFTGAKSVRGWLQLDDVAAQCREWEVDNLRLRMLADPTCV